jgi:glutamine synthetase
MHAHYFFSLVVCIIIQSSLSADSSPYQDILELEQVAFLDCMFTDLQGKSREITIPRGRIDTALKYGLSVNGSLMTGMAPINQSDLLLKLNMDTLAIVPWTDIDSKTARVICNVYRDLTTPHEHDVRYFLEQTISEAQSMGYDFLVGPELEFSFYDDQSDQTKHTPYDTYDYLATENNPYATSLKRTLFNILLAQNIPIEKIHHAIAPGQYEISIQYNYALTIADQLILTKQTIRALANAHSLNVTFMPKPFHDQHGNSMHLHCSLWDRNEQKNAFYDEDDPAHLSPTAKHFMAGILAYIREVNIIFNPTINSYKRLIPEVGAPIYVCWGPQNRSALIRIPSINNAESARIELRSPDPLCSPYLAFGVLLKLGLEGIKNKMPLTDAVEKNVYYTTPEERSYQSITTLPSSLEQAITLFEESDYAKKIMGNTLHKEFILHKKEEFIRYNSFVTNRELHTYFES